MAKKKEKLVFFEIIITLITILNNQDWSNKYESKKYNNKTKKPILKADPQHNSFVYANERALEDDKKKTTIGISVYLKNI